MRADPKSVDYLLRPRASWIPPRRGAAIAVIAVQFLPTSLVLLSYIRFLSTLVLDPGFVARGEPPADAPVVPPVAPPSSPPPRRGRRSRRERAASAAKPEGRGGERYLDRAAVRDGAVAAPPGIERFYRRRDVFTCGSDGLPRFCNRCWCWKPDRTHHSGELQRCVRRYVRASGPRE
jgi:palmitoyltransferase